MNAVEKKIFPNGVTCLTVFNQKKTPVNISIYFPGGRLFENESNAGITFMLLHMMLKRAMAQFEGISFDPEIHVENHADFCGFSLNTSEAHFDQSLKFLYELVINEPDVFAALDEEKSASHEEILRTRTDPLRRPVELFYQSLFVGHSYAFSRFGTLSSIGSFTTEQILDWREEVIQIERMLVVVTGPVASDKVVEETFELFGNIPTKKKSPRASVLPLIAFRRFEPKIEESQLDRTSIVVGHKGVDAKDNRYYDLEVLRNWLAGAKGKLHQSFREKRSIAQSVNAYNVSLLRGGAFFLHAITKPGFERQLTDYMTAFFSTLGKLVIEPEAFEAAKQQAIDLFNHGLRNSDALSYHIANHAMLGKDPDTYWDYETRIQKIQYPQMANSIQQIFSEQLYAVGVVRGII